MTPSSPAKSKPVELVCVRAFDYAPEKGDHARFEVGDPVEGYAPKVVKNWVERELVAPAKGGK